jgi:hypothetical protein
MEINVSKTKSMIITPKIRVSEKIELTILGENFDEVQTFRYLGLTIDKHLTWNTQYQEVCERMSRRIYLINRHKRCVSQNWLQIFCTSLVISVLDYCPYCTTTGEIYLKASIKELILFFSKQLRLCYRTKSSIKMPNLT